MLNRKTRPRPLFENDDTQNHKQIKENKEKVKLNNQLPYLVGNIVEILDSAPGEDSDGEEELLGSGR